MIVCLLMAMAHIIKDGFQKRKAKFQSGLTRSAPESIIIFGGKWNRSPDDKPCPQIIFPKNFYTATDLEVETAVRGDEELLNLEKAIRIPFTISPVAKKGSHILEGRIKYFARSRAENWCVKNTAKFYVTFSTRPGSVRKVP